MKLILKVKFRTHEGVLKVFKTKTKHLISIAKLLNLIGFQKALVFLVGS